MKMGHNMVRGLGNSLGTVALLLGSGCASPSRPVPVPQAPKPQAIVIEGKTSPFIFEKVVYLIPSGSRIGGVYRASNPTKELRKITYNSKFFETEKFNIEITARLSELGYDAIDPIAGVLGVKQVEARFRLVGIVSNLDMSTYVRRIRYGYKTRFQRVRLYLAVQIYDARTESVIYRGSFPGDARANGADAYALPAAIMSAMEGALADPMFAFSLTADPDADATEVRTIVLPRCKPAAAALPEDIPTASESVVHIRSGLSSGSGVLVSPAGHVLTAAHVIGPGRTPTVTLANGLELEATIQALSESSDVALLKIPGSKHGCVVLMSATRVEVGSRVYAMGFPLSDSLSGTVTHGIVSGHPTIEGRLLIQTDAAVNSGNSGGPIFNQRAQVAGIVTTKLVGAGVEGVAFAVPPKTIREKLGLAFE